MGGLLARAETLKNLILENDLKVGAEIGVAGGKLSRALVEQCAELKLYAIDFWPEDYPLHIDETGPRVGAARAKKRRLQMLQVTSDHPGRVTLIEMQSVEAAKLFEDGELDFVFIDADHTYEGCRADIVAWWPKVRKGGWVTGHDYRPEFPGVIEAVDELLGAVDVRNVGENDGFVWLCQKR